MSLPSIVRRLAIAAGFSMITSRAFASDLDAFKNTTPGERAQAQTAMMQAKLGLTDAQIPKIAAINQKYAEKMEPILKGSEGPLMKLRDAREIEQQKEGELKTLLSAEQFQKFQAAKEEMRERFAERLKAQRAQGGK